MFSLSLSNKISRSSWTPAIDIPSSLPGAATARLWLMDEGSGFVARNHFAAQSATDNLFHNGGINTNSRYWQAYGGGDVTVTDGVDDRPAGFTADSSRFQIGTTYMCFCNPAFVMPGNHTIRFWVKSNTGSTQQFAIWHAGTVSVDYDATTTWTEITLTHNVPAGPTFFGFITSGAGTGSAVDLLMFGLQLVKGSSCPAFIEPQGELRFLAYSVGDGATEPTWTDVGVEVDDRGAVLPRITAETYTGNMSLYAVIKPAVQTGRRELIFSGTRPTLGFSVTMGDEGHVDWAIGGGGRCYFGPQPLQGEWRVLAVTAGEDENGRVVQVMYLDGVPVALYPGALVSFDEIETFFFANWGSGEMVNKLSGEVGPMALYAAHHTVTQVQKMSAYLKEIAEARGAVFPDYNNLMVYEGDSITFGNLSDQNDAFPGLIQPDLPANTMTLRYALPSSVLASYTETAAKDAQYLSFDSRWYYLQKALAAKSWTRKVVSMLFGANMLAIEMNGAPYTAARFLVDLADRVADLRAAGAVVVTHTVTPYHDFPTFNTERHDVNDALIVNLGIAYGDAIVDYTTEIELEDDDATENYPAYWTDWVHPSATGHALMHTISKPLILGALT